MSHFSIKHPVAVWLRTFGAALLCLLSLGVRHAGAADVIGHIDGLREEAGQVQLFGWACQRGSAASLAVHVYADHSAYDKPAGAMVLGAKADVANEPAVDQACQGQAGGKHRFFIVLPADVLEKYQGRKWDSGLR
ncbi:hypothetical protein V8J88_21485 [Massilia sp. W12]|uniref:hypothetical protein n=1 Tax=Massilia sp. W12 TaxID=3126507 RepID=UPI0030D18892